MVRQPIYIFKAIYVNNFFYNKALFSNSFVESVCGFCYLHACESNRFCWHVEIAHTDPKCVAPICAKCFSTSGSIHFNGNGSSGQASFCCSLHWSVYGVSGEPPHKPWRHRRGLQYDDWMKQLFWCISQALLGTKAFLLVLEEEEMMCTFENVCLWIGSKVCYSAEAILVNFNGADSVWAPLAQP